MGLLTDFIIAEPTEAEAICRSDNHLEKWRCVESKGVDNIKLAGLWSVLVPGESGASLESEERLIHMDSNEGPWVFLIPQELTERLAGIKGPEINEIAQSWCDHEECRYDGWKPEDVEPLLNALTVHAKSAIADEKPILLWMCL